MIAIVSGILAGLIVLTQLQYVSSLSYWRTFSHLYNSVWSDM